MDIAAYYFPNYHADKRNEEYRGPGWTEWELMKCARPRFEGHRQPKVPVWGYEDEADPQVMAKKLMQRPITVLMLLCLIGIGMMEHF